MFRIRSTTSASTLLTAATASTRPCALTRRMFSRTVTSRAPSSAASAMSSLMSDLRSLDSKGVTKKASARTPVVPKAEDAKKKATTGQVGGGSSPSTPPAAAKAAISGLMSDLSSLDSKGLTKKASARPSTIAEQEGVGQKKTMPASSAATPSPSPKMAVSALCPVCNKKFVSQDLLLNHIRVRHPKHKEEMEFAAAKAGQPAEAKTADQLDDKKKAAAESSSQQSEGADALSPTEILEKQKQQQAAAVASAAPLAAPVKILSLNDLRKQVKKESDTIETLKAKLALLSQEKRRLDKLLRHSGASQQLAEPEETELQQEGRRGEAGTTLRTGYNPFAPLAKDQGPSMLQVPPSEATQTCVAGAAARRTKASVGCTQHFTFSGVVVGEVVRGTVSAKNASSLLGSSAGPHSAAKSKELPELGDVPRGAAAAASSAPLVDEATSRKVVIFNVATNTFVTNSKTLSTTQNKSYVQVRLLGDRGASSATDSTSLSNLDVKPGQVLLVVNAELGFHPTYHMEDKKWSDNVLLDVNASRGGDVKLIRDTLEGQRPQQRSDKGAIEEEDEDGESLEL